jgi:hypothetical protein
MGNDLALAIVRWQRKGNQALSSLTAVPERVDALWGCVNLPTIDGMSTIACRTLGNSER